MHTLLKREKSWANTAIHRLTPDTTSSLFADIFAMDALERKIGGGERSGEEGVCLCVCVYGGVVFLMDEAFSCYICRERSCEELLSTRKQAVCFRQACRAPGPTSHLYSSDT